MAKWNQEIRLSKKFERRALVSLASAVITLLVFASCEGIVRAAYDLPINGFVIGKGLYTWGNLVVNNKFGFRESRFEMPKPKNLYRIIVLGDSITWGVGLSIDKRYTNVLQRMLAQRFPDKAIEVLNFALPGSSTVDQKRMLKEWKTLAEADRIIIGFSLDDLQSEGRHYSAERESFDRTYGAFFRFISSFLKRIGFTYTAEALDRAVHKIAEMTGIIPTWQMAIQRSYDKDSKAWKDFTQALADIKKMSDDSGLPSPVFAVLNHGVYTDKPTDYGRPDAELSMCLYLWQQAEAAASESGFAICSFEEEIAKELSGEITAVNIIDAYPTAELNQIYARKLFDMIAADIAGDMSGESMKI